MNDKLMAIKNYEKTCCKCLGEFDDLEKIHIGALGYGSGFDNNSTQINLCPNCYSQINPKWWELNVVHKYDYCEEYEFEDEIFKYIHTLPLQGQEMVENRYASGACAYTMESQDWIDYALNILPHEKCKEYHMYSPQEKQAYQERFPICSRVQFILYDDGSEGCHCPFGAFGNKDGTAEGHQTQSNCYECDVFELRQGEIMTVNMREEEIKRTKEQMHRLFEKLKKLESK